MIPTIFGFPIWKGHVKRRVAKKYINHSHRKWMLGPYGQEMSKIGIGDFINDCTGFNRRITKLYPIYGVVGTRRMRYHEPVRETGDWAGNGFILIDVDITTEQGGGCSLCSCGVQPKLSVAEIESKTLEFIREWTLGPDGKIWYGKNSEDYEKVVENAHRMISIIESGGHICDSDGQMLEEYRVKL